jgi:hypothetical protein
MSVRVMACARESLCDFEVCAAATRPSCFRLFRKSGGNGIFLTMRWWNRMRSHTRISAQGKARRGLGSYLPRIDQGNPA